MAIGIRNPIKGQHKEQPKEKAAWIRIRANSWTDRLIIAAGVTQIITDHGVNHQAGAGLVVVEKDKNNHELHEFKHEFHELFLDPQSNIIMSCISPSPFEDPVFGTKERGLGSNKELFEG